MMAVIKLARLRPAHSLPHSKESRQGEEKFYSALGETVSLHIYCVSSVFSSFVIYMNWETQEKLKAMPKRIRFKTTWIYKIKR